MTQPRGLMPVIHFVIKEVLYMKNIGKKLYFREIIGFFTKPAADPQKTLERVEREYKIKEYASQSYPAGYNVFGSQINR